MKEPSSLGALDLNTHANVISLLDGYRINYFRDYQWIVKADKERRLSRSFSEKWKAIRPVLDKMASVPRSSNVIVKLFKIQTYLRIATYTSVAVFFGVAMLSIISYSSGGLAIMDWLTYVSTIALVFIVGTFTGTPVINRMITAQVDKYVNSRPTKFMSHKAEIKETVQALIEDLSKMVRLYRQDPKRIRFNLFNTDYMGIEIVRKRGKIRRCATATIQEHSVSKQSSGK